MYQHYLIFEIMKLKQRKKFDHLTFAHFTHTLTFACGRLLQAQSDADIQGRTNWRNCRLGIYPSIRNRPVRSYRNKAVVHLMRRVGSAPGEWRATQQAPHGAHLVTTSAPLCTDRLRA